MENENRTIELFMDLCRIHSPSFNEKLTAEYCCEKLRQLGFEVLEDGASSKAGGNQDNLVAWIEGHQGSIPPVMINAHMDTVDPGGEIEPVIDGDRIRSAGNTILGADNRAGITMILAGMKDVVKNLDRYGRIEVVLTIGEEAGLHGARYLDYSMIKAKHGFSLDSSGLGRIGIGAPYYNAIDVNLKGRSAHAAVNADQGINAVVLMSHLISSVEFGRLDDETTSNVGVINGGVARNVVPDACHAVMEVRSHNENKVENYTRELKQILEQLGEKMAVNVSGKTIKPICDVKVHRECDGFYLDAKSPVVSCASSALKKIGRAVGTFRNMGGSDANVFNSHGMEVAVVGTGQKAVHSHDEYIKINDLLDGVKLVPELIESWTGWWS